MNRSAVRVTAALGMLCCGVLTATSQFRSPLSLEYGQGPVHNLLDRARDAWWTGLMNMENCHEVLCGLDINFWSGAYYRCAARAFCDPCDPCHDSSTRKTASLSTLFFNAIDCDESFRGEEAFPGGMLSCEGDAFGSGPAGEPFLLFSRITPQFDYSEKGVVFGAHVNYKLPWSWCGNSWVVGGRINIPFKVIDVRNYPCKLEETLSDVIGERPLNVATGGNPTTYDFAYRLDLLSCLIRPGLPPQMPVALVEYSPSDNQVTRIAQPVGTATPDDETPPIYLIKRDDGSLPPRTPIVNPANPVRLAWAKQNSQRTGQLAADGSGVNDGIYNFGDQSIDYLNNLGMNREAQGTLFVVGHLNNLPLMGATGYVANTVPVYNAIHELIEPLLFGADQSAVEFFRNQGIDLCKNERVVGQGDLRAEVFFGYTDPCWCYFVHGVFGIVAPTGKKNKDPKHVFFQTTGNNGHAELKFGLEGGWQPYRWFGIDGDIAYNHVFRATEKRAAPFTGATVINIGPTIDAEVSWGYFVGHLNFNIFHPCNPDIGLMVGYELYAKGKDNVDLCVKTAKTFFDVTANLDAGLLERRTNTHTHKIRGEVFYRSFFFEIFGGASQVFAGKNAMKESEAHIGFNIYF